MTVELKRRLKAAVTISDQEFTLASGRKSNVYIDCKLVTMDPMGSRLVGHLMESWLRYEAPICQAFGGPELGACPIVTAAGVLLAGWTMWSTPIPKLFYVRKAAKEHGKGGLIVGPPIPPGSTAILVEDVITTAGSMIRAITAARDAGMVVKKAYALVDREEGGREALKDIGVDLQAFVTLKELQA